MISTQFLGNVGTEGRKFLNFANSSGLHSELLWEGGMGGWRETISAAPLKVTAGRQAGMLSRMAGGSESVRGGTEVPGLKPSNSEWFAEITEAYVSFTVVNKQVAFCLQRPAPISHLGP